MANQFLIKNTMADMRNLSASEIASLQGSNPTYAGVELLGYYEKGDIPKSAIYFVSNTTSLDNGGNVIQLGGVSLVSPYKSQIDIRYFGAKGDGVTDDTKSIQNAIDTGCKIIYFSTPKKYYKVSTIRPSKSQTIKGDGMFNRDVIPEHSIIQGDGENTTVIVGEATGRLRYVKIIDISINNTGAKTVEIDYSPNWEITRSTITNTTGIAVDIRYSWRGSIEKCFISGGGTALRAMDNNNGLIIDGNTLTGGRGGRAVSIGQSQNVSICRNIIEVSLHGIWVASTTEESNSGTCMSIQIKNNYFEQCSSPIVLGTRFTVLGANVENNFLSNGQSSLISERSAMIAIGRVEGLEIATNSFLMDTRGNEDLYHFHMINNERNIRSTTIRNNSFGSPARPANYCKLVGAYATNSSLIRLIGADNNDFDLMDRFDGINSSEIREWISPLFQASKSISISKWITETKMRFGGRLFSVEIVDKQGDVMGCKLSLGINSNINSIVNSVDIGTLVYVNGTSTDLITAGNNVAIYSKETNLYRITASVLETSTGTFRIKIRYRGN